MSKDRCEKGRNWIQEILDTIGEGDDARLEIKLQVNGVELAKKVINAIPENARDQIMVRNGVTLALNSFIQQIRSAYVDQPYESIVDMAIVFITDFRPVDPKIRARLDDRMRMAVGEELRSEKD